jgi:hypothetical protein
MDLAHLAHHILQLADMVEAMSLVEHSRRNHRNRTLIILNTLLMFLSPNKRIFLMGRHLEAFQVRLMFNQKLRGMRSIRNHR